MAQFQKKTKIDCSARELYDWHSREGAFERLAPPWQKMRVVSREGGIESGATIHLQMRQFGIWRDWIAEIEEDREGSMFVDVQRKGPFAEWRHCHEFLEMGPDCCELVDTINYELPGGGLGAFAGSRFAKTELERVFRYRHEITKNDLDTWSRTRDLPRWNVLISGGHGFTGSRLSHFLKSQGHRVSALSRSPRDGDIGWDPKKGILETKSLEPFDAVIHLAGENLAAERWNDSFKKRLRSSRIDTTKLLVDVLAKLPRPPKAFLSASAIGYYGDCGDQVATESTEPGNGFLADLCRDWEKAASPDKEFADKVIHLRTGIVLDPGDGALAKMLLPFKLGLGGAFGSGKQWMSWIALEDWIGAVYHLLLKGESGAYNLTSPHPERNRDFGKSFASVLGRPAVFNVPAPVLKGALGEFAEEGLLASCWAEPTGLLESGYRFKYPDLGDALKLVLGRK